MTSSLFVCLSVCLLATLRQNCRTDLHEIFRKGWQLAIEQMINFCWRSGSGIRILIRIATLVRCALVEVCTVPVLLVNRMLHVLSELWRYVTNWIGLVLVIYVSRRQPLFVVTEGALSSCLSQVTSAASWPIAGVARAQWTHRPLARCTLQRASPPRPLKCPFPWGSESPI